MGENDYGKLQRFKCFFILTNTVKMNIKSMRSLFLLSRKVCRKSLFYKCTLAAMVMRRRKRYHYKKNNLRGKIRIASLAVQCPSCSFLLLARPKETIAIRAAPAPGGRDLRYRSFGVSTAHAARYRQSTPVGGKKGGLGSSLKNCRRPARSRVSCSTR